MSRWNLAWLISVPAAALLGLALAFSTPPQNREADYQLVKLLVDVLSEVDQNFVKDMGPDERRKLVEDMINGGLERLDPYSGFFNERDYKQFERSIEGKFGGIGVSINIDRTTGALLVVSPMVGTPAYEAGILAGDLILKVNGKPTEGMRIGEAIDLIQGDPGTPVTLTVLHEGAREPAEVTVKRAKIEVPSVLGTDRKPDDPKTWEYFVEGGVAHLRLVTFSEQSGEEMARAVAQAERAGASALVLDLRDNPGGPLTSAVDVADLFLDAGPVVAIRDRKGRGKEYAAKAGDTLFAGKPVAVLVNRYSASASEIVAAALQDHKRAVVVGERSFGKGSVQNLIRIPREDPTVALKLTTATYWRPSGKNIHRHPDAKETDEWGVKPDDGFHVKLPDEERLQYVLDRRGRDIVSGKGAGEKKPADKKPFADRVLQKAVDHLKAEVAKGKA